MHKNDQVIKELLLNDQFVDWVLHPDEELDDYWRRWQDSDPGKKKAIAGARRLVLQMRNTEAADSLSEEEVQVMWQNLQSQTATTHKPTKVRFLRSWYWAVASVVMLAALGVFLYQTDNSTAAITHQTTYGETKHIILPDSSSVILNANSSLTYSKNWEQSSGREVVLVGEAFFDVRHTHDHRRFVVQANSVTIEVLGTSFNVHNRHDRTRVVLQEGKVSLHTDKNESSPSEITMKPGELVEIAGVNYTQRQVDVEDYTAWTHDELIFDGTSIADIAQLLEDNYGLEVHIQERDMLSKRFTGRVASDNITSLFGQMEKVFQIDIEQNQQQVFIQSNNP
ncbi:MAG: FecR domain-containing protein [Bacteroidota bacterium]